MKNDTVERLIESARQHLGQRSRANKVNGYGAKVGYNGKPWDGSFLEAVYRDISMYPGTSLVNTTAALAYFTRTNRLFTKPKVGDLVFFAFSTDDDGFGQPHVGLVTSVSTWKTTNSFGTIEGQISSGNARAHVEEDGVYERKARYGSDVLAFARPVHKPRSIRTVPENTVMLRPSQFQMNKTSKGVQILQEALHRHLGVFGFIRGKFDEQTRAAVRRFQLEQGIVGLDGIPDEATLHALAVETDYMYFSARKLGA